MDGLALHGAAEEGDVHAVHIMLVDQHGDVAAGFEHAGELDWGVQAGRHKRAHAAFADLNDGVAHRADIRSTVEHRGVELVFGRDQRRQFPVGEMGGEDQGGLAVLPQLLKPRISLRRVEDVALALRVGLEDLQAVDVGEFRRHPPEIVPDAA